MRSLAAAALAVIGGAVVCAALGSGYSAHGATEKATISCARPIVGGKPVRFRASDGWPLNGVLVGRGRVAVLLVNDSENDNFCAWPEETSSFLRLLRKDGFRLLLFDLRDWGVPPPVRGAVAGRRDRDVVGAVAELRRRGARRVFVIGSGLGGLFALIAAPSARAPVGAVISLSPHGFGGATGPLLTKTGKQFGNLDGKAAVRRLRVPLLFIAAEDDLVVEAARSLYRAAAAKDKRLVIVPGFENGTQLIGDPGTSFSSASAPRLRPLIVEFIRDHTG